MTYRLVNPFSILFLSTALFSVAIAALAYRNRSRRAAVPLAGFMIAVGIWCFGDGMRIAAPSRTHVLFWNKVSYIGIVSSLPTWVTFVLSLTNRERWLKRRYILGMIGASLLAYLLVLTNFSHGLWRAGETITLGPTPPVLVERRGLLWYPWAIFSYTLVVLSLYLLLREFLQRSRSRTYRNQIGLILVGSLIAIGSTAVFLLGIVSFDPTPIGVMFMGLAYTAALYRYRLLDITPIARDVVLGQLDSGVLVLDPDERIIDANERAREILGETALVGERLADVVPDEVAVGDHIGAVRDGGDTVDVTVDGETLYYDVEISPIYDSLNTYLGRVVIFTDATERVQREHRLWDRSETLERQNERLDQFASTVSHDLRNPLQVTSASIDLAQVNEDFDELDRAQRSIDRMEEIIDDLLALARASETVDPDERTDVEALAIAARQQVPTGDGQVHVEQSLPTVQADPTRFQQVLENLVRNAVEHNEGPVTVKIGSLDGNPASGVYVEDDGVGIPSEERQDVFEHGYSTNEDGTGFGLSIVRDVVEAHGWSIQVVDAAGGGARFEITFE